MVQNKITIDQLATALADMVFKKISETSLQSYKVLMEEGEEIDARRKKEFLVFGMLAATRAVLMVFTDSNEANKLLDKFHVKIYSMVSDSDNEQTAFEEFVNKRYQTYYQILNSKEENVSYRLGKQFTNYFLNKDLEGEELGQRLVLILAFAKIFYLNIETWSGFLIFEGNFI